jgi:Tol biopolymer transport system component
MNNTQITVSDFKWLEAIPAGTFPPMGELAWQNPPIEAADLKDYVMVGRDSRLEVGRTNQFGRIDPILSGYLLNLKTGDLRRLPFHGALCLPGCFLSDRSEVVVSGLDPLGDMMGLFKVNLLTGENRRLTPDGLGYKVMLAEDLSPDGKQLVTISAFNGASVLDFQVSVLDLKTEELKPIGKPARIQALVSWLPDGDGFVLSRPESDTGSVDTPDNLTLMDMKGVMRDIRRGRWPVVLHKSRKILYQNEFELWYTCDLDGKNPELFADGLRGHGIPTVSPDERQVLFVQFPKGKLPRIRLFELGKSQGKFVVHASGLTTMPVWR